MTDCPLAQTRHVNAREVLNAELLAALQGALGGRGGYLWVPSAQVDTARERAARVAAMRREGQPIRAIAEAVGVSTRRVHQILARQRVGEVQR